IDPFWQKFKNCPSTVIYKFLGNTKSTSHRLFGNKIVCRSAGKIIRYGKYRERVRICSVLRAPTSSEFKI
ncbi:hypothetical protein GIB67_040903, partial [Kingdonia uniflora]